MQGHAPEVELHACSLERGCDEVVGAHRHPSRDQEEIRFEAVAYGDRERVRVVLDGAETQDFARAGRSERD